ncbi:MAG TPA: hypothetical protein EYG21_03115 [Nitrospinaceae bacterium]|jgi:hypothetical protein|nr:hypothetical protein [Nitrospinaceae bacterium]
MPIPKHPSGIAGYPYDSRNDLGYGTLNPQFNEPRSFEQYSEPPIEDVEAELSMEPDTLASVLSKLLNYHGGDSLAWNGTDPFYYAGAATKLSELSTAKGMVPFPKMYAGRTGSGFGGAGEALPYPGPTAGFRSVSRPTGTKRGFSKSPYPEYIIDEPNYELEDILAADEDEENVSDLKKLVYLIHQEQEDENS